MCGIAGIFNLDFTQSKLPFLEASVKLLAHRGPDGQGTFESPCGRAGLAHTRLAIIDLSEGGAQPMQSSNSECVITFNGEIYNFETLKSHELLNGVKFQGSSDTEVLLQFYRQSSSVSDFIGNFLPLFNGMFAFAIWDEVKQIGLIARDRFGVKPLYYSLGDRAVVFASEIKALQALTPPCLEAKAGGVRFDKSNANSINSNALDGHMNYLWNPNDSSIFPGVKKLGPGEWLLFRANGSVEVANWAENTQVSRIYCSSKKALAKSAAGIVSDVAKLTRDAVHAQMISDVPVGAFLSGGLDSSTIVTFAREKEANLQCFTIRGQGYDFEGIEDDYPYAKAVASHLNVALTTVDVTPSDFIEQLYKMVEVLEEPTADPAALNVLYISEVARRNGIKVLLSGTGGDDVFSGYRRHLAIYHSEKWSLLPITFRKFIESWSTNLASDGGYKRRVKKLLNGFSMSEEDYLLNCFRWSGDIDLFSVYSRDLKEKLKSYKSDQAMSAFLLNCGNDMSQLKKTLAMERRFFLADHNLTYSDKMSMAAGVEVRVPFLDQELVEFSKKIPDEFLIRGSCAKWVLKKAMEPYLPKNIIYRPKTGFGLPIRKWIKNELNDFVNNILNERVLRERGLFDPSGVKYMIKANMEGSIDASYTILSMICVELWCQRFLDN